jgi:endonuclease YncB( thermonuclease family)
MEALLGGLRLEDELRSGPAPAFVSGPWRIAVTTSAVSPTHPELGLKRKKDKEWMIVILDVTNWSDEDAELSARDFTIMGSGDKTIGKIARKSMSPLADQLGLEPFADKLTMQVPAGESRRIALVYVIPKRSASPRLVHETASLPLSTTIELKLPSDLSTAPVPLPEARAGEIVSASDGQTLSVLLDGRARAIRIQLLGVEPAADGECGEHAAQRAIDDLTGAKVLVEEDAAVRGGADPLRYVWLVNDDGARTLLNHALIAEGKAMASPIPSDARFGLWLAETEHAAEQANTGLWAGCPESGSPAGADRRDEPTATPADR